MKYSIIITAYNSAKYIKKCLDSIINQTVQNFKVLVIDDGSKDNTKEIIAAYRKNYKNIEYYYKENGGVSDARNYGASKVKTPYFLYVDSDDYIPNDLIETVDKYSGYDLLSFKATKVDEKGKFIEKLEKEDFGLLDGRSYLKSLIRNNSFFLVPWGYVYKTEFWRKHNFEYSRDYVLEDTSLTPIIIMNAEELISLDYYGYYYVQTNESITRTKSDEKIKFNTKCALYHYDYLINYVESRDYSDSFNTLFFHFFAHYLIWYGATLPDNHLNKYAKELRKRNVADRLRNQYLSDKKERAICNFSYRFYIFRSKNLKWKIESIYFKYKRKFNNLVKIFKTIIMFIYWKIFHTIICGIRDLFVFIYWKMIHKTYIFFKNGIIWIYYNIFHKLYWKIRKIINFIYWRVIRKFYFEVIRKYSIQLGYMLKRGWNITYNFLHNLTIKTYWVIRNLFNKIYWKCRAFIIETSIKIYWGTKGFFDFIFWKIIHKAYWKIRGFAGFVLKKLRIK